MDDEIEKFKSDINLSEYAAGCLGYCIDHKKSSRNSIVMKHTNGDKIIIAMGRDGHWIYFNAFDDQDNGSIIDLIQKRKKLSLGYIRKELRPWIGEEGERTVRPPIQNYASRIARSSKDIIGVVRRLQKMRSVTHHDYLINYRGIHPEFVRDRRFSGRIYIDAFGSAVFPHYNRTGICGYEIKNKGYTGFSKGGEKGLWISRSGTQNQCLVVTESAIDALSYGILFPDAGARYASIGGNMSPQQPDLIRLAALSLPENGTVIAAVDSDPSGDRLSQKIKNVVLDARKKFKFHQPELRGKDWNECIKSKSAVELCNNL